MDAIALLKDDHDKMKKMLADGETTTERGEKTRDRAVHDVKDELSSTSASRRRSSIRR